VGRPWPSARLLLPLGLLLVTGCGLSQSPFARETETAGSQLTAAAVTLEYAHTGRLATPYANSGFVFCRSQLSELEKKLATAKGAPDPQTVQQLIELYRAAQPAIDQPCLDDSCDWQAQVAALQRAGEAFRNASGG
jgi:hypothetical protein